MTKKIKEVERSIDIYFDNGFKVVMSYKIDGEVDDYINEDFSKHWKNKDYWWPNMDYDCEIKVNGNEIDELDMSRVIAVKYN